MDEAYRPRRRRERFEGYDERPCGDRIGDLVRKNARHPEPGNSGIDRSFRGVDHEPRTDRDRHLRFALYEGPDSRRCQPLEGNAVVGPELLKASRHAAFGEISGACTHHAPDLANPSRHEAAVRQCVDPNSEIDMILQEIDHAVGQHHGAPRWG